MLSVLDEEAEGRVPEEAEDSMEDERAIHIAVPADEDVYRPDVVVVEAVEVEVKVVAVSSWSRVLMLVEVDGMEVVDDESREGNPSHQGSNDEDVDAIDEVMISLGASCSSMTSVRESQISQEASTTSPGQKRGTTPDSPAVEEAAEASDMPIKPSAIMFSCLLACCSCSCPVAASSLRV